MNLEDPAIVWEKVQEMYQGVSNACLDNYLLKLEDLKMWTNVKIMWYANRLVEVENELAMIRNSFTETEKRRALPRGLRKEFPVTARVIRASDMKFSNAISELVIEEGVGGAFE